MSADDDFMEVEDNVNTGNSTIYLSSDEDLITDDEDDIVQILVPEPNRTPILVHTFRSPQVAGSSEQPNCPEVICLDDLDPVEVVQFSTEEFPQEYRYLLSLPSINDEELKKHMDLFNLVFNKQTTVKKIIDKEIAIVCLYWAQSINECGHPLLEGVGLKCKSTVDYKSSANPASRYTRITFEASNTGTKSVSSRIRSVKRGMLVFVRSERGKFCARVQNADFDKCQLVVRVRYADAGAILDMEKQLVNVFEIPQEFVPISMLRSIEGMRSGFMNQIVVPQPEFKEPHASYLKRKNAKMSEFIFRYDVSRFLTPSQADAVFSICNNEHKNWPFVLFGPPGTGKTFTISHAIQTILKMDPRNRVLVCTPSNMAADRVAEQLMKDFGTVMTEDNVLRLKSVGNNFYQRDKRFDNISSFNLDEERYTIPVTFGKWRIVVCTLGCSSHIVRLPRMHNFFSHIFIDEAGQSSEAEIWIPLGGLSTSNTSVILCGDPKQLGPVITLDISKALQNKFTSPLVRYMEMEHYMNDERLCTQLVDCFRCPKPLVDIVSLLFYDETLKSTAQPPIPYSLVGLGMSKDFPILYISVDSEEEKQAGGYSYCNPVEANIVVDYADYLIETTKVAPEDIGVISPYTYQSKFITDLMKKHRNSKKLARVIVNSVERFQGSEREVIIMTATRTKALGFMADDLRVNTSITRAKKMLFVIGNEGALRQHTSWQKFIMYCRAFEGGVMMWDSNLGPPFKNNLYEIYDLEHLRI